MTSPFGNGFLSWLKLARKCEAVSYQLSALGSASIGSKTPTFSSLLQLLPPAVRNLPVKEGEDRVLARGGIQVRSPTQSRYGETAQTQRLLSGMIPQRYWLRPKRMRDALACQSIQLFFRERSTRLVDVKRHYMSLLPNL